MHRLVLTLMATLAASSALAQSNEPIALRDMGSFHIGGRLIEVAGQPIKEIVFTPGGVPAKVDPNGTYQVEQMYAQYFLVQNRQGQAAAAVVARRRAHRRHLRDQARRRARAGSTISCARAGTPTSRTRWSAAAPAGPTSSRAIRCSCRSAIRGSASASGRSARGMTTRRSARPIRACSFRSTPMSSS